ncbi:MAG: STAS domain-containing protein [Bacteroidetes bacterium]|nr:STAS domain-containing protein [Bacteroidota bacterium]
MNFITENINNVVVFKILETTLEGKQSADFKSHILIVAQPNIKALVLDLTNIAIIDSSCLGALLLAYRQLNAYNIPVILVGVQEFVLNILELTRIRDLYQYYKTTEEAIDYIIDK